MLQTQIEADRLRELVIQADGLVNSRYGGSSSFVAAQWVERTD